MAKTWQHPFNTWVGRRLPGHQQFFFPGLSVDVFTADMEVLSLIKSDGSAVLLVGFNELQAGFLDPEKGTIERMRLGEAAEWFEQNGNQFITYERK